MARVTTEVINNSDMELVLKEGNAGTYRKLATLEARGCPKCRFSIECNTAATYREYWVGTAVKDGNQPEMTISSDDCVEYETIYIINDPNDPTKVKLDPIKRGGTVMVNRTDGVAKVKALLMDGTTEEKSIQSNEKIFLQPGSKECSVELEGGKTIPITKKEVARNQRVDITTDSGSQGVKLDMVTRGLYLTEVTNRSSGEIQVKHLRGSGGVATELARLQKAGKFLIRYDPKKDDKYSVEYSSATAVSQVLNLTFSNFADFATIDVIDAEPAGMKALQMFLPRPLANKQKDGIVSRFLGWLGF